MITKGKKTILIVFLCVIVMFSLPKPIESVFEESSSVYRVQMGISGEITAEPKFIEFSEQIGEDKLIIPTTLGVYIISEGEVERYIPTTNPVTSYSLIDDIDGDGITDIILGTEDTVFPNIQAYSVGRGKRIWTFKSHMEMYRDDIGWYQHQPSILEIGLVKNEDNNKQDGIVVVSGYSIYLLNPATGEEIWEYKNEDNVWDAAVIEDINGNNIKEIVFGDQRGTLHVVDGENGEKIWEKTIVSKYQKLDHEGKKAGDVYRSIWKIEPVQRFDGQKIVITGEDANVYMIEPTDGTVLWQNTVYEYSDSLLREYYDGRGGPTGMYDSNFFNVEYRLIPDVTNDGQTDILVTTFLKSKNRIERGRKYTDRKKNLLLLDGATGDKIWEVSNLNYENLVIPEVKTISEDVVIVLPEATGSNIRNLTVIEAATGEVKDKVALPEEKIQGQSISDWYLVSDNQSKLGVITSSLDAFIMSEDLSSILWSIPRIAYSKFLVSKNEENNNLNNDVLVLFHARSVDPNQTKYAPVRAMKMFDGESSQLRWSYTVSDDLYNLTGGIRMVQFIEDLNHDGYQDVIAAISSDMYRRTNEMIKPEILVVSGKDGSELSKITLKVPSKIYGQEYQGDNMQFNSITSMEKYSDANGDGVDDIFVSTMKNTFILDGKNSKTIQFWTKEPWTYNLSQDSKYVFGAGLDMGDSTVLIPGDINGDKISDIAVLGHERINIGLSKKSNGMINYYSKTIYKIESGGLDYQEAKAVDDIDGDGIKEILVKKWEDNTPPVYQLISSVNGDILVSISDNDVELDLLKEDFNGDAIDDIILFQRWSDNGPKVQVVSGKDGAVLWEYSGYKDTGRLGDFLGDKRFMPVCPIQDITGDGIKEIALVRNLIVDSGLEVEIFNVAAGDSEAIDVVSIQDINERIVNDWWNPGIHIQEIKDEKGDSILAVTGILGGPENKATLFFVNTRTGETISSFDLATGELSSIGNQKVIVSTVNGDVRILDTSHSLKIESDFNNKILQSPIELSWTESIDQAVTRIYVDGLVVAQTVESKATVDMPKGKHEIRLQKIDQWGKQLIATTYVEVEKKSDNVLKLMIATLVFLIVVVMIPFMRRRNRHWKVVKDEQSDSN